ncbi:MAG: hypothetical protein ACXAC7_20605, partial [Candidatus Hodarchaeales archaeon]
IGFHNLSNGNVKFGKIKKGEELQTMVWVDENRLLTGGSNGNLHLWKCEKAKIQQTYEGHNSSVSALTKGKKGSLVYSGDSKGEIRIWNFDENTPHFKLINVLKGHKNEIQSMIENQSGEMLLSVDIKDHIIFFDCRVTKQETEMLTIPLNESLYDIKWGLEDGTFYTIHKTGIIRFWEGFQIKLIEDTFQSIKQEFNQITSQISSIPKFIREGDINYIHVNEIKLIELKLQNTEKIFTPSITERFKDPFWLVDNFSDTIEGLERIDKRIKNNIQILRDRMQDLLELERQKKLDLGQIKPNIIEYLNKISLGSKISVDFLAEYFKLSVDEILTILKQIENEIDIGVLKREIIGNYWQMPNFIPNTDSIRGIPTMLCYNCGSEYHTMTNICPSCEQKTKKCNICNKMIAKNQVVIPCPSCNEDFHFACFEGKIKLFGRCPTCRKIVDFESVKHKLSLQQKKAEKINISLSRMISMAKSHVDEEKDEDDDLFDF